MTTVDKVKVAGEIEVAPEFGFEDKGYTFHGEDQPYPLKYSRSQFEYATLPPIDLAFRIGATGPIAGKWRWQATVGPYLNFASYKSDAEVSSQQAAEQDKNTLGAIEYGASLKLQGSTEILSGFIRGGVDVGPFFEARLGGVGFHNPTGETASYIGAYQAHDWGTDKGSNPMVGEIGLGAVFGPLNVGIFADTGLNTDFANLGEKFDHYTKNDDGTWNETPTKRTPSYTSGSGDAASSISQFGSDTGINKYSWSIKAGVDLIALGRMIVITTAPKRAEKAAEDKIKKEKTDKETAEAEAKAAAAAKEKADVDAKAKEEADAKKKAEADAARTQIIKVVIEGDDSSDK